MEPNLTSGQRLIVVKAVYFSIDSGLLSKVLPFVKREENSRFYPFHPPERGEIVVFRFPQDPSRNFIKRIIGKPGETIEIREGEVYIDGSLLDEPYIEEKDRYSSAPLKIPPDHYFVLGDNRKSSNDSRNWGTLPRQNIIGKAWLSYWPTTEWGLVPNYSLALTNTDS